MGGSRYSTLPSASGIVSLAKYSNPIQIWGAGVKTELGLILAEPVYELPPFVPEVPASPAGKRQFSRDSHYRNRPRMRLLQKIAINMAGRCFRDRVCTRDFNRPSNVWGGGRSHHKLGDGETLLRCMLQVQ